MGKGVKPEYSLWDGKKLDYIEARKEIYIPLYSKAVRKTEAFKKLKEIHDKNDEIYLVDFDAHNFISKIDFISLFDNPNIKVGHAYVLAMMLEGII